MGICECYMSTSGCATLTDPGSITKDLTLPGHDWICRSIRDITAACPDVPQLHLSIECACSMAKRACGTSSQGTSDLPSRYRKPIGRSNRAQPGYLRTIRRKCFLTSKGLCQVDLHPAQSTDISPDRFNKYLIKIIKHQGREIKNEPETSLFNVPKS